MSSTKKRLDDSAICFRRKGLQGAPKIRTLVIFIFSNKLVTNLIGLEPFLILRICVSCDLIKI